MHDWPKQNVDNDDASLFFLPYPPLLFNPKTLHFHPHKQLEQLADLAVVNERLAGGSGSQARARVDFLREGLTHARLCAGVAAAFADATVSAEQRRARLDELGTFRRKVEGQFIANYHWLQREEASSWGGMAGYYDKD